MKRRPTGQSAFTLVELAIVITIIGLLLGPLLTLYSNQIESRKIRQTWENLETIRQALAEYQFATGHYPCPAGPALTVSDINHGQAVCLPATVNPGGCDTISGECRTQSYGDPTNGIPPRDYDKDGKPDTILTGSIPLAELIKTNTKTRLSVAQTVDGWGNLITYAVTESMTNTDPSKFHPSQGVIRVVDEHNQNILDPVDSAHYVLLSLGQDGNGAYSQGGGAGKPCAINQVQSANCLKPYDNSSTYVSGLISKSPGLSYNDDLVRYETWTTSTLWASSGQTVNAVYNTNASNVGIGTQDPKNKLDINGDFRSTRLDTNQFCDASGSNCYGPEKIGGDDDDMKCAPGTAVNAIGRRTGVNSHDVGSECATPFAPVITTSCPAGSFMSGYSNKTGAICCAVGQANCPPQ
jgi:prepilin-type N-terminal cleavage/methylation domain-containing protein